MTITTREMMSHEEFSFLGVGRRGGGYSAQSLAQFLLQVSYKKMKEYSKGYSKVLLCKGKT